MAASSIGTASHSPEITAIDLAMMQRAIELANSAAELGEVPVGAVVYKGADVLGEAYNIRESSGDATGHAELLAIGKAGKALGQWRLTDCTMAVTLEPCPMCAGALVNARLTRLIYGCADPKAGAVDTLYHIPTDPRLNHRVKVVSGVLAEQCSQQLKQFFQQRRKGAGGAPGPRAA